MSKRATVFVALVYGQMLLGALVAGLDAGLIYNTWPDMNGDIYPENAFYHSPWWINFFENQGLVQFNHRIGAYIVAGFAALIYARGIKLQRLRQDQRQDDCDPHGLPGLPGHRHVAAAGAALAVGDPSGHGGGAALRRRVACLRDADTSRLAIPGEPRAVKRPPSMTRRILSRRQEVFQSARKIREARQDK